MRLLGRSWRRGDAHRFTGLDRQTFHSSLWFHPDNLLNGCILFALFQIPCTVTEQDQDDDRRIVILQGPETRLHLTARRVILWQPAHHIITTSSRNRFELDSRRAELLFLCQVGRTGCEDETLE